jgi:transposase-like protein
MPKRYPAEFRRKVLDLLRAGRTVAQVANDLQISDQTIYLWRRQELIDTGRLPGVSSGDLQELTAARRRIAELELEVAAYRRAAELLKGAVPPKVRFAAVATMAAPGHPDHHRVSGGRGVAGRVLQVALTCAVGPRHPACLADRHDPGHPRRQPGRLRRPPGARRAASRAGPGGRARRGRAVDAPGRPSRSTRQPPAAPDPGHAVRCGSGRPAVHPRRPQSAVGHRHHRTPHPRRQGLLRGRAGRLLPPSGRLVDRLDPDRPAGHQHPGHGTAEPPSRPRHHHPLRPRGAARQLDVHPPGPGSRPRPHRWDRSATATTTA